MNRTGKFVTGVLINYGNQLTVMVVGLWLTPFLLKHLGQRDYGIWLVGLQSLTYLALMDLGVIGLLPREVAFASGQVQKGEPTDKVQRLMEDSATVVLWQTPFLAIALLVTLYVLKQQTSGLLGVMTLIFGVYGLQFPLRIYFAGLEGLQDFRFVGVLQFVSWALGVIVNVTLVFSGKGLYSLAWGWAATQGLMALGTMVRMYWKFPQFAPRRLRWLNFGEIVKHFKAGVWVSVSQITQMLIGTTSTMAIAYSAGPSAVVPFSCTQKLIQILSNQPAVILQNAQPGLTQLRATATKDHISRVIGTLTQAVLMMSGALSCAVLAINRGFVERWVGKEQFLGVEFTIVTVVAMLVRHLNTTAIYTLFCFGRERYLSIVGLVDSIVTAGSMVVMVYWFGSIGAPLATLVFALVLSIPLNFKEMKEVTGKPLKVLFEPVIEWFKPFAVVAVVVTAMGHYFVPRSYFECGVLGAFAVGLYCAAEYRVVRYSKWSERMRERLEPMWLRVRSIAFAKGV